MVCEEHHDADRGVHRSGVDHIHIHVPNRDRSESHGISRGLSLAHPSLVSSERLNAHSGGTHLQLGGYLVPF